MQARTLLQQGVPSRPPEGWTQSEMRYACKVTLAAKEFEALVANTQKVMFEVPSKITVVLT